MKNKELAHTGIVGEQHKTILMIETKMEETKAFAQSGSQQVEKANDKNNATQHNTIFTNRTTTHVNSI